MSVIKVVYGGVCRWLGLCAECGALLEASLGVETQERREENRLTLIATCLQCKRRAEAEVKACPQCKGWYVVREEQGVCLGCGYAEFRGVPATYRFAEEARMFGAELNLGEYPSK